MKTITTCVRKIHFCSGHRVFGHESKCATPHGHNYNAYVTAEAESLDQIGRVIDFSVLKEKIGGWIETYWDHTFLVYEKDHMLISALQAVPAHKPCFICPFNPTAENMADYLLHTVAPQVLSGTDVRIIKVVIEETENCYAEASFKK